MILTVTQKTCFTTFVKNYYDMYEYSAMHNMNVLLFQSADRCARVSIYQHMEVDTLNASVGTVVTYSCERGYRFEDGAISHSLTCSDTTQWVGYIIDCQRKYCNSTTHRTMYQRNLIY